MSRKKFFDEAIVPAVRRYTAGQAEASWAWTAFIQNLSDIELVRLQHELREYPEDNAHLKSVLEELGRRKNELDRLDT